MAYELKYNEPFSNVYNHHGFQTGIMLTEKRFRDYLFSQYIQIFLSEKDNRMEYDQEYLFEKDMAFIKSFGIFPMDYWRNLDIINYIQMFLKDGFYLLGFWDESLVRGNKHYGKKPFVHNYMIIGYDDSLMELIMVGYHRSGHWQKYRVTYSEYMNAVTAMNRETESLEAIQLNKYFDKSFDYEMFKGKMYSYLTGEPVTNSFENERCAGGLDACKKFLLYQKHQMENISKVHDESFYLFKESKEIMIQRLKYLGENRVIEVPLHWLERYKEMEQSYDILLLQVLKYKFKRNMEMGERVYSDGMKIIETEEKLLEEIYRCL